MALTTAPEARACATRVAAAQQHWPLRFSSRVFLPVAAMLTPALLCAWFIRQYGVNVLVWDDWEIVPLVTRLSQGALRLADLWAQHNEHRMFFPNLLFLVSYKTTHLNTIAAMYVNWFLLCAACYLLVRLRRRHASDDLWWDVPIIYVLLSLAQWENLLWAFQAAWYVVLVGLIVALSSLAECDTRPARLPAAIAAAVVASCSSLQGLLVWPCGMIFMIGGRCSTAQRFIWTLAGAGTMAFYFFGLDLHHARGPSEVGARAAIRYFLIAAGSATQSRAVDEPKLLILGVLTSAIAAYVVFAWLRWHRQDRDCRLGAALIAFGFFFDVLLVLGRSGFRPEEAAFGPRYATYNLWFLAGVYVGTRSLARHRGGTRSSPAPAVILGSVLALIVLQVAFSYPSAIHAGRFTRYARIQAADIVANYKIAPAPLITRFVYPVPSVLRERAREAERYGLSLFAAPQSVQAYVRQGLIPGGRLNLMLVPPPALRLYLSGNPKAATAWRVLSAVYLYRRDLQTQFPPRSPLFARRLLVWATTVGVTRDGYRVFLGPYAEELNTLLAVLSR